MPPRYLLVDDNPEYLENLSDILEPLGEVHTATTAREALELATREPFDVVLTDLRMPGESGLWLVEALRARRPTQRVVVLSASAHEAPLDVEEVFDKGAPIEQLLARVRGPRDEG